MALAIQDFVGHCPVMSVVFATLRLKVGLGQESDGEHQGRLRAGKEARGKGQDSERGTSPPLVLNIIAVIARLGEDRHGADGVGKHKH
jgi:hypothetical protein